jgi:hypothetical protein
MNLDKNLSYISLISIDFTFRFCLFQLFLIYICAY